MMRIYLSKIYKLSTIFGAPFIVAVLTPLLLKMLEVEEFLVVINVVNSVFLLISSLIASFLLYAIRFKTDNQLSKVIWLMLYIQAAVTHAALAINATFGGSTEHIPFGLLVCAFIPSCFIVTTSFLSIIANDFIR